MCDELVSWWGTKNCEEKIMCLYYDVFSFEIGCVCVCLPLRTSKLTFFEDFELDEEEVVVGGFGVCLVRVVI